MGIAGLFTQTTARAWSLSDDGLEMLSAAEGKPDLLLFGDKGWSDYIFECEAKKLSGNEGFLFAFRAADPFNLCWWNVGGWGNANHAIEWLVNGERQPGITYNANRPFVPVELNKWNKIRVQVSGTNIKCWRNDELISESDIQALPNGMVGLGTWETACSFRNIKVTDLNGKVLFSGMPKIP